MKIMDWSAHRVLIQGAKPVWCVNVVLPISNNVIFVLTISTIMPQVPCLNIALKKTSDIF
jgi:hypothetical protein